MIPDKTEMNPQQNKSSAPEGVNVALNIPETFTQLNGLIDKELISYFSSKDDAPIERLGAVPVSVEDQLLFQEIQKKIRQEIASAKPGGSGQVSIRAIVFHRMPEEFERYETLIFKAKSKTLDAEMGTTLLADEKEVFVSKQQEAIEVFKRMQKGEEFVGIVITDAERALLDTIRSIPAEARGKGYPFSKLDILVYQNFIQKTAYYLVKNPDVSYVATEEKTKTVDRSDKEVDDTKKERAPWQEVIRISDQEAIGDLNGSYKSFIAHLSERGLINATPPISWCGGNKRVVFVGDILGDRTANGMKIMEAIASLNEEAVKDGGSVESLSGNHDNMFNAVIGGFDTEGVPAEKDNRIFSYAGTLESAFYAGPAFKDYVISRFKASYENTKADFEIRIAKKEKIILFLQKNGDSDAHTLEIFQKSIDEMRDAMRELDDIYNNVGTEDEERFFSMLKYIEFKDAVVIGKSLCQHREAVLKNMQNSLSGKKRLEAVCSQKLCILNDDTLYTHTNLTFEMTQEMLKGQTIGEGIDEINNLYQRGLRHFLLGEGEFTQDEKKAFDRIRLMFISTSQESRINFSEDLRLSDEEKKAVEEELIKKGVNLVIHGHNDESGVPKGSTNMPIVSIDRSVFKFDESWGQDTAKATMTIDTKGNVRNTQTKEVVRE